MRNEILGNYALVRISSGKHKGEMGYYDNEDERGKAIVYLEGSELLSGDHVSIRSGPSNELKSPRSTLKHFKRENPSLAKAAGIR